MEWFSTPLTIESKARTYGIYENCMCAMLLLRVAMFNMELITKDRYSKIKKAECGARKIIKVKIARFCFCFQGPGATDTMSRINENGNVVGTIIVNCEGETKYNLLG